MLADHSAVSYEFSPLTGTPKALGVVSPGQMLRGKQAEMKTRTQSPIDTPTPQVSRKTRAFTGFKQSQVTIAAAPEQRQLRGQSLEAHEQLLTEPPKGNPTSSLPLASQKRSRRGSCMQVPHLPV